MEQPKFETVEQVFDYLKQLKVKQEKLVKRYPEFSIYPKTIDNLSVKLIFDIYEKVNEKDIKAGRYIQDFYRVKHSAGKLSLYANGHSFTSVKVKSLIDVPADRDMYIEEEQEAENV